jgi:DNA-binding FadR family transcriptional regulator
MGVLTEQREHAVTRASKIYALLKQVAEAGDICPTNAMLAERFGCGTARIVSAFHFLEANGMILVERGSGNRVVTIFVSGLRTAGEITKPRQYRKAA